MNAASSSTNQMPLQIVAQRFLASPNPNNSGSATTSCGWRG